MTGAWALGLGRVTECIMPRPYPFWALAIRVPNANAVVEGKLLMTSSFMCWLMKLRDERSNMQLRLGFDFVRPIGVYVQLEIGEPLTGHVIAYDNEEELECRDHRAKDVIHITISIGCSAYATLINKTLYLSPLCKLPTPQGKIISPLPHEIMLEPIYLSPVDDCVFARANA